MIKSWIQNTHFQSPSTKKYVNAFIYRYTLFGKVTEIFDEFFDNAKENAHNFFSFLFHFSNSISQQQKKVNNI